LCRVNWNEHSRKRNIYVFNLFTVKAVLGLLTMYFMSTREDNINDALYI